MEPKSHLGAGSVETQYLRTTAQMTPLFHTQANFCIPYTSSAFSECPNIFQQRGVQNIIAHAYGYGTCPILNDGEGDAARAHGLIPTGSNPIPHLTGPPTPFYHRNFLGPQDTIN